MTRVQYSYWTGTNWVPQYIEVDPPMKTGWHIVNVLAGVATFGAWFIGYGIIYWLCYASYLDRLADAERTIQQYYASIRPVPTDPGVGSFQ